VEVAGGVRDEAYDADRLVYSKLAGGGREESAKETTFSTFDDASTLSRCHCVVQSRERRGCSPLITLGRQS